ncbi:thiamine diphosphokinase [Azotosporobacter soli]|uniref:thiamine diphosphokinase n=1 Tax=Azotosporobacter soli TaxID=3055040 RepID=UPI0031FF203C
MIDEQIIRLPQLTGRFSFSLGQEQLLVVAGGRMPQSEWLTSCSVQRHVWCADRGVDACRLAGIVPEVLLGDRDSGTIAGWQWASEQGSRVALFPQDKDWTDLQLVLQEAGKTFDGAAVIVSGAFGGRFDHAWANATSLIWSREWGIRGWIMADEQEALVLLPGPASFEIIDWQAPEVISLLPLAGPCNGVQMKGGHWSLPSELLEPTRPATLCNRPEKDEKPAFQVESGWLGIYFSWDACQVVRSII